VSRRRVLLIGEGLTAASALEALLERFEVVGIVRTPHPQAPDDDALATAHAHGVRMCADASPAALWETVHALAPECVVVSSYDRILAPSLIALSRFVNVHYAPLPAYRGRANVNWAIINGEPETALTVHVLTARLDAGGILFQQRVPIGDHATAGELYATLNALQRRYLAAAVDAHLDGDAGTPQDERQASYGCTRVPEDGLIDWAESTRAIYALVRALTPPYPGAFTYLRARPLRVWRAAPSPDTRIWAGRVPGRVVDRSATGGWVDVLTGDGVLRLETVEPYGELEQPASDAIPSIRLTLGLRPAEVLERLRLLETAVGVR
jgi:methionyl-tRNA formyltransferase